KSASITTARSSSSALATTPASASAACRSSHSAICGNASAATRASRLRHSDSPLSTAKASKPRSRAIGSCSERSPRPRSTACRSSCALDATARLSHEAGPRVAAAAPVAATAVHEVVTHGPELCPQEAVTSAVASEAHTAAPQDRAEGLCHRESELAPSDLFSSATQCAAADAQKAVPHDEDDDAAKSDSELCCFIAPHDSVCSSVSTTLASDVPVPATNELKNEGSGEGDSLSNPHILFDVVNCSAANFVFSSPTTCEPQIKSSRRATEVARAIETGPGCNGKDRSEVATSPADEPALELEKASEAALPDDATLPPPELNDADAPDDDAIPCDEDSIPKVKMVFDQADGGNQQHLKPRKKRLVTKPCGVYGCPLNDKHAGDIAGPVVVVNT
ncbi:MAG: hypothetical protein SGPRY_009759, partial [Prymnesium sp.]